MHGVADTRLTADLGGVHTVGLLVKLRVVAPLVEEAM
jgi:hypothetical protein